MFRFFLCHIFPFLRNTRNKIENKTNDLIGLIQINSFWLFYFSFLLSSSLPANLNISLICEYNYNLTKLNNILLMLLLFGFYSKFKMLSRNSDPRSLDSHYKYKVIWSKTPTQHRYCLFILYKRNEPFLMNSRLLTNALH